MEAELASEMSCLFKKNKATDCPQKEKVCRLTQVMLWSIWDFLCLKLGLIGCPETSRINCHFVLRNIPEERRFHMTVW
jgi:hypothetical protein